MTVKKVPDKKKVDMLKNWHFPSTLDDLASVRAFAFGQWKRRGIPCRQTGRHLERLHGRNRRANGCVRIADRTPPALLAHGQPTSLGPPCERPLNRLNIISNNSLYNFINYMRYIIKLHLLSLYCRY